MCSIDINSIQQIFGYEINDSYFKCIKIQYIIFTIIIITMGFIKSTKIQFWENKLVSNGYGE